MIRFGLVHRHWKLSISPARSRWIFRPGRIESHEHAETGKPCSESHAGTDCPGYADQFCGRQRHAAPRRAASNSSAPGSAFRVPPLRHQNLASFAKAGRASNTPEFPSGEVPKDNSSAAGARRSSLRHLSFPVPARLHPALPQAPTGNRRWAERYDGKRDLYFQHAA